MHPRHVDSTESGDRQHADDYQAGGRRPHTSCWPEECNRQAGAASPIVRTLPTDRGSHLNSGSHLNKDSHLNSAPGLDPLKLWM